MQDPSGKIAPMLRQIIKFLVRCISAISAAGVLALFLPRIITAIHANNRIKTFDNVSPKRIAIVFGAGLWRDGSPTPVLRDRVTAAADLYFTGKVEKLYFSGDNRYVEYNEPGAMLRYALNLGVPREAVVLDFAGRSTYDTCYRAKYIFGIDEAILVTQNFHLPRALYICHVIGIDVVGVPADRSIFSSRSIIFWNLREVPATLNALWQVHISHPLPVMGEPEFIFPPQEAQ
jgi:vancomycin permeability regulator SanA